MQSPASACRLVFPLLVACLMAMPVTVGCKPSATSGSGTGNGTASGTINGRSGSMRIAWPDAKVLRADQLAMPDVPEAAPDGYREALARALRLDRFRFLRFESYSCGDLQHTLAVFRHEPTAAAGKLADDATAPWCEFVLIPGGSFMMGLTDDQATHLEQMGMGYPDSEMPSHRRDMKPFLIARTITTQRIISAVAKTPSVNWKTTWQPYGLHPDAPASMLTWRESRAIGDTIGLRLPSEAEWEYSARGGSAALFCFGDGTGTVWVDAELSQYAWYFANSGHRTLRPDEQYERFEDWRVAGCKMQAVATLKPNAFGLYDPHGNVWQFCEDLYVSSFAGAPTSGDAWLPANGEGRLIHGGCFDGLVGNAYSASRSGIGEDERSLNTGVRFAATLP